MPIRVVDWSESEEVLTSPRAEPKGADFWNSPHSKGILLSVKIGTIFGPVIPYKYLVILWDFTLCKNTSKYTKKIDVNFYLFIY